jgi:hypothetical protein
MSGKCHLEACPNLVWLVPGVWLPNGKRGCMQQKVQHFVVNKNQSYVNADNK